MYRNLRLLPVVIAMLIAALACNAPSAPSADEETATALFGTIDGGQQTAIAEEGTASTPTNPPANSTATSTAAPQQCVAKANTALNVRTGPSTFHPIIRILAEGATGVVTGRNADSSWWQIDLNGWVSAPFVTTSGPCTNIPIANYPPAPPTSTVAKTPTTAATATFTVTPSATVSATPSATHTASPTPLPIDFNVTFIKTFSCGLFNFSTYQMANQGTLPIESIRVVQEGPVGTTVGGQDPKNKPFKAAQEAAPGDCLADGAEVLGLASSAYVFDRTGGAPPPSGTSGKVTVTACSKDNLNGECNTKSFTFMWP